MLADSHAAVTEMRSRGFTFKRAYWGSQGASSQDIAIVRLSTVSQTYDGTQKDTTHITYSWTGLTLLMRVKRIKERKNQNIGVERKDL